MRSNIAWIVRAVLTGCLFSLLSSGALAGEPHIDLVTSVDLTNTLAIAHPGVLDIDMVGRVVYMITKTNGMYIFNVSTPTSPWLVGMYTLVSTNLATCIQVEDGLAYIGTAKGLEIVDVQDSSTPQYVSFHGAGVVQELAIAGPAAYLGGSINGPGSDGQIVDVSNPYAPVWVGALPNAGHMTTTMSADGEVLIYASLAFSTCFDISEPFNPVAFSNGIGQVDDFCVNYPWAYVIRSSVLEVWDLSGRDNMSLVGSVSLPSSGGGHHLDNVGSRVYVTDVAAGLMVFDASDPAEPILLTYNALLAIKVGGTEAIVAAGPLVVGIRNTLKFLDVYEYLSGEEERFPPFLVPGDYSGDGLADLAVFNRTTGSWYIRLLLPNWMPIAFGQNWGFEGCIPVFGDYNGDGVNDLAVYESATGNWFIRSLGPVNKPITFGQTWGGAGMVPVSGDYDGDKVSDLAVYDESTGNWFIWSLGPGDPICFGQNWGGQGMVPVSGDYNDDGLYDLAVYDQATGNWYVKSLVPNADPITFGENWGAMGLNAVVGDYNGDGLWDLALFEESTGNWFVKSLGTSPDPITFGQNWGAAGFQTVPGDYNGDGVFDLPVYDQGNWYIRSLGDLPEPIVFGENWGW